MVLEWVMDSVHIAHIEDINHPWNNFGRKDSVLDVDMDFVQGVDFAHIANVGLLIGKNRDHFLVPLENIPFPVKKLSTGAILLDHPLYHPHFIMKTFEIEIRNIFIYY